MQRFFGFFLSRSLLEAWAFAAESEFDHIVGHALRCIFWTDFNDALHVAALGANQATSNLEVLLVFDLDIKAARVFHCVVVIVVRLLSLESLLLFWGSEHIVGRKKSWNILRVLVWFADRFFSFGQPFDHKNSIVLAKIVIVEALLSEKSTDKVFKSDERILLVIKESDWLQLAKQSEYL